MTKRIVLLTTNLARGGAEAQVALLAFGLRKQGWDVAVVSMLPPSAFAEELEASGVTVYSLGMQPGVASPLGFVRLANTLRKLRPAVVHCHMFHANLLGRLVRLICPVPVVISTAHSMVESSRRSGDARGRERLYRLSDSLSDATVAVCEAARRRYAELRLAPARKLRVIPNGVDTARFRPDAERRERTRRTLGLDGEFTWLAVGRLMWKKDYPALIRAFAALRAGMLLIAGEGEEEASLRALADELVANVRFLGARDDVPELMKAADAFVLSSVVEGLPVVLLEAAASGVPCVTTDVGGAAEAVLDGVTGFVATDLKSAMCRLMTMPVAERRAMGEAARKHAVERFDAAVMVEQWERLYCELYGCY